MDLLQSSLVPISGCRSLWVTPAPGEATAPARRIVHSRDVRLPATATLKRLGLRLSRGFMKCGSTAEDERDWIRDARLLVGDGDHWRVALEFQDRPRPKAA